MSLWEQHNKYRNVEANREVNRLRQIWKGDEVKKKKNPQRQRWRFYDIYLFFKMRYFKVLWVAALNVHFKLEKKKTNTKKQTSYICLPSSMHPIANINKKKGRKKKKGQVHEDRTHFLYKRIIWDRRKNDEIKWYLPGTHFHTKI